MHLSQTCDLNCTDRQRPPVNYLSHMYTENKAKAGTHTHFYPEPLHIVPTCGFPTTCVSSLEETGRLSIQGRARAGSVQTVRASSQHLHKQLTLEESTLHLGPVDDLHWDDSHSSKTEQPCTAGYVRVLRQHIRHIVAARDLPQCDPAIFHDSLKPQIITSR